MEQYICSVENKKSGEIILEQGKDAYYAYVMLEGKADVYRYVNNKQVFVGTIERGELFGILSFITSGKRSATIIANSDVKVGMIPKGTFMENLDKLPIEVRDTITKLRDTLFMVNDAKSRLLNCLNELGNCKYEVFTRQYFEEEAKIESELVLSVAGLMSDRFASSTEEIKEMLTKFEEISNNIMGGVYV
ncbi:MAG: hypothetical protein D8M57_07970 [Candidatus Scalindua sp. AMX11]|nr:MAG: hypothetical protein DWQ00_11570 [Candidatus Scalindua sp.]NOG85307.1 cyclic nucleotide-binding domain-containing protein [Planctomycetota bacterium]RZV81476.1 MAG: cyclic nucleotide-binding domain-containing protein [Candidatus Scalindua sp. SCAELEC01]TDE65451.1 MAG: hypothetical protein D8M57_07970 [Candidatus Scalindua sp. AMX11]GJQ59375.1 MAG: hypothetical protein SCALA701_21760 [Candidatus Scalindua sp.]